MASVKNLCEFPSLAFLDLSGPSGMHGVRALAGDHYLSPSYKRARAW